MAKHIQDFKGIVGVVGLEVEENVNAQSIIAGQFVQSGLLFSLNQSEDGYIVGAETGSTFGALLLLPDFYNGLPVVAIATSGFLGHTELKHVRFPQYLQIIGAQAFSGCTALVDLELPKYVNTIGSLAFANCTALAEIYAHASTPATLGSDAFQNLPNNCAIYVAPNSLANYQSAWTATYGFTTANIQAIQLAGNAQTATKASTDGNGDNIVSTYAKQAGNYANMSVGYAKNAGNAQKTSFSNGSIITIAGGLFQTSISLGDKFTELFGTDTEGDFEIQLGTLVGEAALVSFGVVHIDLTASNLPLLSGFAYNDSLGLVLVTATLSVSVDSQTNLPFDLTFTTKAYRFATDAYSKAPAGSLRIRRLK